MICDTNDFHSNAMHSKTIGGVADSNSFMFSEGFFKNVFETVFEIPLNRSLSVMLPNSHWQLITTC